MLVGRDRGPILGASVVRAPVRSGRTRGSLDEERAARGGPSLPSPRRRLQLYQSPKLACLGLVPWTERRGDLYFRLTVNVNPAPEASLMAGSG
jgi:hypothetical protein